MCVPSADISSRDPVAPGATVCDNVVTGWLGSRPGTEAMDAAPLLRLAVIVWCLQICGCTVLESIYWNTSNTRFVPGKGLVLYPQIGDKIDIVCPRLRDGSSDQKDTEYFRVYLVPREQLESCQVTKNDMALLHCIHPFRDVKFTLKFQEFSPNMWGLEFLKGKDYHIISTSNGTRDTLDNQEGGVCKFKSMKLVLRVGQTPPDTVSEQDNDDQSTSGKEKDVHNNSDLGPATDTNSNESSGQISSKIAMFATAASVGVIAILLLVGCLVPVIRRRRRQSSARRSAPVPLNMLPSQDTGGSNNNGLDPSNIIFPLHGSDSTYCPHYKKVSGDYGSPVYIVQDRGCHSPANIYYKV